MRKLTTFFALAVSLSPFTVFANQELISTSPGNAAVYFIAPQHGQVIDQNEIEIKFGLSGMGIAPAGVNINNTGHHHLLIDLDDDQFPDLAQPLPSNNNVKHFGKGQTQTAIPLEPGRHTLQLLLGNHLHIPHDPPVMSEKITITIE